MRIELVRRGLWAVGLTLFAASCADTTTQDPPEHVIELLASPPDTTAVLSRSVVKIAVTGPAGEPAAGLPVEVAVDRGDGWVYPVEAPQALRLVSLSADSLGHAEFVWESGASPGAHRFRVSAPDAEPLDISMVVEPGAVFVGYWTAADERDDLPSDSMRAHSTWLPEIADAQQRLAAGDSLWVGGYLRAGTGVDSTWVFHIPPQQVHATSASGSVPECVREPPLSLEELAGHSWTGLCPRGLVLVRVEEVPESYLSRLAAEGFESPLR